MKHTETAFFVQALTGERYLATSQSRGVRWTTDISIAVAFVSRDRAMEFAHANGVRSLDCTIPYMEIDAESQVGRILNLTAQNVSIAKAKIFRADGRVEQI